jgi:N-acyl-D-amino-acid deacylase
MGRDRTRTLSYRCAFGSVRLSTKGFQVLRKLLLVAAAAALLGAVTAAAIPPSPPTIIRGASVIDGTGAPARTADVRIAAGRVTDVGRFATRPGDRVVEARGLVLAPGFIDSHSHHDRGLAEHLDALAAVSQGVTTIVVGQDGESALPLRRFFAGLVAQPAAVNVASYVGHGTLRGKVMGDDFRRAATDAEVARMRDLLREEMDAGALGLSTGLEYDPGIFSAPDEVLALAKSIAPLGGRYISHIRSEDREFWPAIDELLRIGREARIPVEVSHMKLAMRGLWGQGERLIAKLDGARREGIEVTADVYPYTMWSSTLTVLYPKRNFADRAETEFILKEVAAPEDLVIGDFALDPSYVGKNVGEIAALRGTDAATTLMALIAESQAKGADESVIARGMDERDVERLYRWPYASVSSDGSLAGAHPRGFGSFTRVLGRYVRERKVLGLEEAIRRMTSLPASSLGLPRGTIEPGAVADLVLLDAATVGDRATLAEPHALSVGVRSVWVGGEVVYADGRATGATPGRVLRRADPRETRALAIDRFVRAEMERQEIPGLAIGIVDKGVVTARGYGYANVEHMVPVTEETIFQSGSLGKMFTATAVMLLVEDGKIALADPITRYFPDAPASWGSITVRHLLTHTSGIPDYTTDAFDYRKDYTEDELARLAYAMPSEFPAGSRWSYSNTGYALLGFVVRKASGQFYGDVLAERVFQPLGMTATRVISEADIVANRAAGYQLVDGTLKNQDWVAPKLNTTADGSLYFSLKDLLAWDAAVKRRAILKPGSWEQILTPVRLGSGKTYPYGFGWFLDERGGHPLHQHGGSWQGFKTQLSRFLGDDLSVIVLANLAEADPARIADGIAARIDPRLEVPVPMPIPDHEPQAMAKLHRILDALAAGTLTSADFAYVRAGFFPETARYYRKELERLGRPSKTVLVERREVGDDRVYLYEVTFGEGVYHARVGLAPDDRVSQFSLRARP